MYNKIKMKSLVKKRLFIINTKTFKNEVKEIKTKNRSLIILPHNVGKTFKVHTGKNYLKVVISKEMIGFKLGEFARTRKIFKFKKKLK